MTLNASIWNKHHDSTAGYTDVRLCPAGVILTVANHTEVLVPWHRVHEVFSHTPGEIALEIGQ